MKFSIVMLMARFLSATICHSHSMSFGYRCGHIGLEIFPELEDVISFGALVHGLMEPIPSGSSGVGTTKNLNTVIFIRDIIKYHIL